MLNLILQGLAYILMGALFMAALILGYMVVEFFYLAFRNELKELFFDVIAPTALISAVVIPSLIWIAIRPVDDK